MIKNDRNYSYQMRLIQKFGIQKGFTVEGAEWNPLKSFLKGGIYMLCYFHRSRDSKPPSRLFTFSGGSSSRTLPLLDSKVIEDLLCCVSYYYNQIFPLYPLDCIAAV